MNQRALIVAALLFVVIVLGMFGYAYKKSADLRNATPTPPPPTRDTSVGGITHIDAKHFFVNGTHTVAGEIMMPTPCDLLESRATVGESLPEQVTITFNVLNNAPEACAQVITPQRFKVSFEASENATITATLDGRSVTLNLIPAGADESPDDFELFIKG